MEMHDDDDDGGWLEEEMKGRGRREGGLEGVAMKERMGERSRNGE